MSIRTPAGVIEDPEGRTYSSLEAARDNAFAKARDMILEGDRKGEDRRDWSVEIKDGDKQQVLAVALADALDVRQSHQREARDLMQPEDSMEMRDNQEQVPQHHQPEPEARLKSPDEAEGLSRTDPGDQVRRTIGVRTPRLQAASGRVKVWPREILTHQAQKAHASDDTSNPLYLLAAITLGIPAIFVILLVGMNPGIQEGAFMTLVTFLVISAFIIGAVFEIKRLADHRSDGEQS